MDETVLARASGRKPIKRILIEPGERVFYLANPERIDAVRAGVSDPVGFPKEDVFEFDEGVFVALADQWARQRANDPATWRKLTPYSSSPKSNAS
jgi:hypothetical protein